MTELPDGWQNVRFGDIFKVKYGKAIDKALRKESARYPVVGSAGIMTYTDEPLSIDPTIVIGRKGNVGSIQIFENGCYPIDTTYYMQPASQFDIKFLTLLLTSLELVKLDSSTATPSLRREDLENVSFFVPPLPEQQKIVEILEDHLSRLDAALADVKQAKLKAAQFRRSLLQSIFEGQYSKNSDLWGRKAIGDFAEVKGGKRLPKGTKWSLKPTSHPYIRATDIKCGQIKTQELVHVPDSVWKSISRYIVEENDVLITIAGTIGEIAVVPSGLAGANLTENAAKLVFDHNFVLPSYLSMYLQSPNVQNEFKKLSRATTQSKLALYRIATVEVPIPSLDEQQQIMELIDEKLSYLTSSLSQISAIELHATSLRRSLLQAAFTGQLTKEVASV